MPSSSVKKAIDRIKKHPVVLITACVIGLVVTTDSFISSVDKIFSVISKHVHHQAPELKPTTFTLSEDEKERMLYSSLRYSDEKIGRYLLVLEVKADFTDKAYNREPFLKSIANLKVSLPSGLFDEDAISVVSTDIKDELSWWVVMDFPSKPPNSNETLTLSIASKKWSIPLGIYQWQAIKPEANAKKNHWYRSDAELTLNLENPDWPLIRFARLLEGVEKNTSVLEVQVENLSDKSVSVDTLELNAYHSKNNRDACGAGDPGQILNLNWTLLKSGKNQSGASTVLNGTPVKVRAGFNDKGACSDFYFNAYVPMSNAIPPKEVRSLFLTIKELPQPLKLYNFQKKKVEEFPILQWETLQVGLNRNEQSTAIYPFKIDVAR